MCQQGFGQGRGLDRIAIHLRGQFRFNRIGKLLPRGAALVDQLLRGDNLEPAFNIGGAEAIFAYIVEGKVHFMAFQPFARLFDRVAVFNAV